MRPIYSSLTVAGPSVGPWLPIDPNLVPTNIGFGVTMTATGTYTVEHTFDDVFNPAVTPVPFPHPFVAAQTTNKDGNYAFPIRAVRLNAAANTGVIKLTLLQGLKG